MYSIDNIVIPMALAKVEKLPYKDILTPRCGTKRPPVESHTVPTVLLENK